MNICQDMVRQSGSIPQGSVAFGLPSSVSMVLSVPLAETVRVELPKVKLRAIEAMSGFIRTWLQDETIDLGFLYERDDTKLFEARGLMHESLHFFASTDNWPLARAPGAPVPLGELAGLDLVLPSQHHGLRKTVDRYAQSSGLDLNVVLEMDALSL
jgi:LysR family transcriptional regulator, nitrogen assimilation regulatory protein